ncbi:MAG: hypothetical protein A3F72_13440 [Bacteroidetes bacterium RIFCSPLOWO2_12_FULL_35_15]|nr:MAG: hypothetical protein A3F72_13440 [Bacteroidetes bacterium RIFCSPLOWO2_12_FULL_35_15]
MNIVTEYPTWFFLFCLSAGFVYSFFLYRKDKKLDELSIWFIRLMATFRFSVVTILSFLLLSPLLKSIHREVEKPIVIIAQDNSESLIIGKDSSFIKKEYKQNLQKLINDLSDKYEVYSYSFADKIKEFTSSDSLKFNEKQTDFSSLFAEIETRYSNRNVGAIVLSSDGLYNKGFNPIYSSEKIKVPIYTIALGDTTVNKDIILLKAEHNRLAYLGNEFPVEIVINAKQFKGKTTTLTVSKGDATLFTQTVNFNSDAFIITVPVLIQAKEVGLQHYKVKLSSLPEEVSVANNISDVFMEVLDARQKILILSDAPHPDIAAIKESIESNQNYEVESYLLSDFDKSLKKYNLVILHTLPSVHNPASKILSEINASNIPVWSFSGASGLFQTDLSKASYTQKTNEVEPVLDQNFPLFTISDELRKAIKDFPAVVCPFSTYQTENNSNVLFYQRIGIVDTKKPLMLFNTIGENKVAIFTGEGIWRWRLQDFAAHNDHNLFDEFISKTVQYLSVKADKSFFRISGPGNFQENEAIQLEAEVYNESYELINEPEVNITISNSENKKFPFTFSKTSNAYRLNAGMMPVGEYSYEAKVKIGEKIFLQHGKFSVSALQIELSNTTADHQLLFSLAKKHNGEMVYPNELDKLVSKLNSREDIKSVSYSEKKLSDLINLKWIFFLLLGLLSIEWFLRKRNGAY